MGHFGKRPIRVAWFAIAFPALVLSYLGQASTLLTSPDAAANPFYRSTPSWLLYPMVVLATMATVIASQALISAVFSMTRQAMQLGLTPRMRVVHTSADEIGQVYLPTLNWALMVACLALVIGFGSSTRLAAAFGLAVSGTMAVTTILFGAVAHRNWGWSWARTAAVAGAFLVLDLAFLGANLLKAQDGGWIPLAIGAVVSAVLLTWRRGRTLLARAAGDRVLSSDAVEAILGSLRSGSCARVGGTAVFLDPRRDGLPRALLHNLKHNRVLHRYVVLCTVETALTPTVAAAERITVTTITDSIWRVVARFGFTEEPDVPAALQLASAQGVPAPPGDTTYFLSRETVVAAEPSLMTRWRLALFALLLQNARSAALFYNLPPNRVVELGSQVEI
jgi:KUP system potassium uptake protein